MLVGRYVSEMGHVTGDPRVIDQNFVNLIDHLYGPAEADRVRERLHKRRRR